MEIYRGQIFWVKLGPTQGKKIDTKRRPVAVLSVNDIIFKPLVVIVVPGTSWKGKKLHWNEVGVEASPINGLNDLTLFQCHQIKAIDHSRFDQESTGKLSAADLEKIQKALWACLGYPRETSV